MAFIDAAYYANEFKGNPIPESKFDRLAELASDVIDGLITVEMTYEEKQASVNVKKATAYQLEFMYEHGGIDTILGYSDVNITSESLGGYSVSTSGASASIAKTVDGIPVSPMALQYLRKDGLMCRWMYANRKPAHGI
jgi:hypothetical protein